MKIGMMSFAHMHATSYANYLQKIEGVEITAVYDADAERGKQMAETNHVPFVESMEAFLSLEMDAVIVCSENSKHKELVVAAAHAGKHVLCEKPLATTVEDAEEMIHVCKEHGVILQTAFPVRFSEPIRQLKEAVDRGELGDILAIRTTNRGQNPGGWFVEPELSGGGATLDHTVHMVDIMRWILNDEVEEVTAHVDRYSEEYVVDDAGLLTLRFSKGVIASHDASWSRFPSFPMWGDVMIEIIGTKGHVRVDAFGEVVRKYAKEGKSLSHDYVGFDFDQGLIEDFVETVKKNGHPTITGEDGLRAMEVALAAYQSSKLKKSVSL